MIGLGQTASKRLRWGLAAGAVLALAVLGWRVSDQRQHAAMMKADPEAILADPRLKGASTAMGRGVFVARCASCHGRAGEGDHSRGAPDLRDADWLYGEGHVAEIEMIARHGIRSGDRKGWSLASMPAYATARPYHTDPIPPLTPKETRDVAQYLISLDHRPADPASAARGATVYAGSAGCSDCHGVDAKGDPAIGAPNLTDGVWLYGDGSAGSIERSIEGGRAGVSPAFERKLSPAELRAVAVYVASLSARSSKPKPRKQP